MTQQPRICILGGGFGGLYTALRLSQLPFTKPQKPEIILVDRSDRFLFSPLLYELLTGELQTWEIAPPFAEILKDTDIHFYQGAVSAIDLTEKRVQLQDGQEIICDRLVLALGGETPLDLVSGASEHAFPFRTISDAYRLEERLKTLEKSNLDKIRIAVVGAGYCGVELACKLSDRLGEKGRLRLIEQSDTILRSSPDFNREAATKALEKRQIWIDLETTIDTIGLDTISLLYKGQLDILPVDAVLWTVGMTIAPAVRALPLPQNMRGQLIVEPTLQIVNHPTIFALGDITECVDVSGQKVPPSAQAAIQQADYTAWNIWASLTNRPLLPFRYQPLGEILTLGVDNATFAGLGIKLDGQMAHLARRLAYLYRMPTLDHQIKVGFNWIARPIQEILVK
ncbi:NADH dehydrogenase [Oscillatoriales cyanobacterium USR001]|nr:NADH dehydrogenase [Oscillatoriales cyanobacterium USR001]